MSADEDAKMMRVVNDDKQGFLRVMSGTWDEAARLGAAPKPAKAGLA